MMSQAAEEPPRKRQRVTQACHRCRCKKYKCDSVRPTCSTCRSSNSECTYGTVAKRRGLQSGYVRAVEILWGLVLKKVNGSQNVINNLLVDLSNITSSGSNDADTDGKVGYRADDLLECWKNSGVPSAIEMMLDGTFTGNQVGVSADIDSQVDTTLTSIHAWSLPQSDLLQGTPPGAPSPLPLPQAPTSTAAAIVSDASYPLEDMFATSQLAMSPLPSDWHSLAQNYFTIEHTWIPIFERHSLFRIAYHYQDRRDSQVSLDDRQRGEYAILWAIFALGEIHSNGVLSSRATHFESQSRYFLDKDPVQNDYATYAQAFLFLSMINVGCNKSVVARSMLAQAFVYCTAARIATSERQCTLTLSGCFVMDALLALATGAQPLMSADDLPSSAPCDESGSDEWEPYVERSITQGLTDSSIASTSSVPSRVSSTYNHLVKLCCILNTALKKQTPGQHLTADIETWRLSLPRHLTMRESSTRQSNQSVLPPQLHLRAFYSAVSYVVETRNTRDQPQPLRTHLRQGLLHNTAASILQIGRQFGAQAMPASVSVLMPFVLLRSSSIPISYDPTTPDAEDVLDNYKVLWGWDQKLRHDDQDHTEATLIDQSVSSLPSPLVPQDPLHAAMHCEISHGLPATFDLGTGLGYANEQTTIPKPVVASGETNTAGLDLSLMTTSGFDDVTASGTDSMLADTPTQLLDYLALLQENERYTGCLRIHLVILLTFSARATVRISCSRSGSSWTSRGRTRNICFLHALPILFVDRPHQS